MKSKMFSAAAILAAGMTALCGCMVSPVDGGTSAPSGDRVTEEEWREALSFKTENFTVTYRATIPGEWIDDEICTSSVGKLDGDKLHWTGESEAGRQVSLYQTYSGNTTFVWQSRDAGANWEFSTDTISSWREVWSEMAMDAGYWSDWPYEMYIYDNQANCYTLTSYGAKSSLVFLQGKCAACKVEDLSDSSNYISMEFFDYDTTKVELPAEMLAAIEEYQSSQTE